MASSSPDHSRDLQLYWQFAKTISGRTGCWILLPFIGWIVWVVTTQGHLNRYWELQGVPAA